MKKTGMFFILTLVLLMNVGSTHAQGIPLQGEIEQLPTLFPKWYKPISPSEAWDATKYDCALLTDSDGYYLRETQSLHDQIQLLYCREILEFEEKEVTMNKAAI